MITRGRVAAWHDAWGAVTAGISLQEYLTRRLRAYLSTTPPPREPLPFDVSIDNGEVVLTPNPEAKTHEEPAGEDSLETAIGRSILGRSAIERQVLLREFQQLTEEEGKITARLLQVDEDLTERTAALLREVADGQAPPATLARAPRRRGRPRQPFPWVPVLGSLAIALTVLVEAWQFAIPWWNVTGVDVSNLATEWHRNPVGILMGGGFAVATAVALFYGWYWVISATASLARRAGLEPWWTTAARAVAPLGLLGALLTLTMGLGAMRHDAGRGITVFRQAIHAQAPEGGGSASASVFVLLTIIVPLAVAYLQHQLQAARERERPGREQRVQAEEHARQEYERRTEPIRQLEAERADLARRHAKVQAQFQRLTDRAQAREDVLRETVDAEHQYSVAYGHSLVAALERDRFYYVWATAKKRGTEALGHG